MKTQNLFLLLLLGATACHQSDPDPNANASPVNGTYAIYQLTQYQDNKIVLDGSLPYTTTDNRILTKKVSVEILNGNNYSLPVALGVDERITTKAGSSTSVGGNLSSTLTYAQANMNGYDFYQNGTVKVGHGDGIEINFDVARKDSSGHTIRYVFTAKKVDPLPGHY